MKQKKNPISIPPLKIIIKMSLLNIKFIKINNKVYLLTEPIGHRFSQ